MYKVRYKAEIIVDKESPVRYKPLTQTGVFIPKGKTCKDEKIKQQVTDVVTAGLKKPEFGQLKVSIIEIKKIPCGFIVVEDKPIEQ
jgi:hypothetical protein